MKTTVPNLGKDLRLAKRKWGVLPRTALMAFQELVSQHCLYVALGDLLYLDGKWYVTHSGLLRLARRNHCSGIHVQPVSKFCDSSTSRWAFKATVYKSRTCKGFVGYGDADPSNVSPVVRGAEMRVAETRAVNRALRKAYGIGICSVEEIGAFAGPRESPAPPKKRPPPAAPANGNGRRLRDQLCLLIRQHQLDPALVKLHAADFCGTPELRQASREQVESFVNHLADYASKDRQGLLCQLNSYAPKQEGAA